MNKKSIGALLLSAALLVGSTGATFAYFNANAKTDTQTITLGNVKVAFSPTWGKDKWELTHRASTFNSALEALLTYDAKSAYDLTQPNLNEIDNYSNVNNISYLAPGDIVQKSFVLKNTGKLDAKVSLSLENMKVLDKDGATVDGTATSAGTFFKPNTYLFKAYTLDSVTKLPKDEVKLTVDAKGQGNFVLDAKTQEEIVVYAIVALDDSINNDAMDQSVQFNVRADATQWNNPGWDQ